MKKLLALLLALCMVLCLAACGDKDDGEDKKEKNTQSQDDKDDKDDKDDSDSLREGLTAFECDGLRLYAGDEFDIGTGGYAESEDMTIDTVYILKDEAEELAGYPVNSASDLVDFMVDMYEDSDEEYAELLERGVENKVDYLYISENADEGTWYYVIGVYYQGGCFWRVNVSFEDESLADTAIKYATICEIVGLPEEDEEYGDDEDENNAEAPNPADVIGSLETEDFRMLVCDIDTDGFMGPSAKLYVENKSGKELQFLSDTAIVDGLNCESTIFITLEAGKSCYDELYLTDPIPEGEPELKYSRIDVTVRITESENYTAPEQIGILTIYPNGQNNVEQYVRELKPTDVVLLDNDYITVYLIDERFSDMFGYTPVLYMVNKSGFDLEFTCDQSIIDGVEVEGYFSAVVSANGIAYGEISFFDAEDDFVAEAGDVMVTIVAKEVRDWFGDAIFEDTLTITH